MRVYEAQTKPKRALSNEFEPENYESSAFSRVCSYRTSAHVRGRAEPQYPPAGCTWGGTDFPSGKKV